KAQPSAASNPAVSGKRGLRILVTDDNRDAADSLAMLLEYMGHTVTTRYDGLAALAAIPEFHPQVIVLDIGMPSLNGYETARRIRKLPGASDIILIAMTGWGQDADKRQAQEAGFEHHLTKPVDPGTLEKLLVTLM